MKDSRPTAALRVQIRLAVLLGLALLICAPSWAAERPPSAQVAAEGAAHVVLPAGWSTGARLDGKQIVRVEQHREYIRVHLEDGGFELGSCPEPTDPWCAGDLRLQPLPNQPADEAMLVRRLAELRARPAVATPTTLAPTTLAPAGSGAETDADGEGLRWWLQRWAATSHAPSLMPVLLALLGLWFALLATRDAPAARRGLMVVAAMTVAAPVLGHSWLGPASVGTASIAQLHESSARETAHLLVGTYANDQPAWLLTGADHGIHGIVAANRLLWAIGVAAMVVWMRVLLANWGLAIGVVALAVMGSFNLALMNAELETPEIWIAICAGAAAFALAADARRAPALRWLAALYLPLLTTLVDRRRETLLLVAAALLALAWQQLRRSPAWRGRIDRVLQPAVALALHPVALWTFAAAVVAQGLLQRELTELAVHTGNGLDIGAAGNGAAGNGTAGNGAAGSGVSHTSWIGILPAMLPTDLSFVFALLNLAAWSNLLLPVLVLCGGVAIMRERRDWLWLLVTTATVYKVYRSAGHAFPFEVVRYLSTLAPFLAAFAALGLRWAWPRFQALTPTPGARRLALLAVGLAAILDARYGALDAKMGQWLEFGGPQGDQQASFLAMASALHDNPDCAIVTRSTRSSNAEGVVLQEGLIVFGDRWREVTAISAPEELPRTLAARTPAARCALVLDGLDCRGIGSEGCAELGEGPALATYPTSTITYRHAHWGRPVDDLSPFTLRKLRAELAAIGPN